MGERKVLNKYFPPDFDPIKLPKRKRTVDNKMKVRMMMSMSVRCETCGVFISKGTKFNMRKEDVTGENYLGIYIYRFYFRCPQCSSEITFKTDPKNSDYLVENGAHRTAEPLRKRAVKVNVHEEECITDDIIDQTKSLVYHAKDLKRERESIVNLEKLQIEKTYQQQIEINSVIAKIQNCRKEKKNRDTYEERNMEENQFTSHLDNYCTKNNSFKDNVKKMSTEFNIPKISKFSSLLINKNVKVVKKNH